MITIKCTSVRHNATATTTIATTTRTRTRTRRIICNVESQAVESLKSRTA